MMQFVEFLAEELSDLAQNIIWALVPPGMVPVKPEDGAGGHKGLLEVGKLRCQPRGKLGRRHLQWIPNDSQILLFPISH